MLIICACRFAKLSSRLRRDGRDDDTLKNPIADQQAIWSCE